MSRQFGLYQWVSTVATQMPHLSRPQATVLAFWSFGMVMVGTCGTTTVATFLAQLFGQKPNAVRQRLREWYWDATDKQGAHRRALEVTACFPALLRWVLAWWSTDEHRIALALDATTLGQRFTVLVISVLYRGCAIPVAWEVVAAATPGAWKPHWLQLIDRLDRTLPARWTVIVLADRGLYAQWLYQAVVHLGWHPFLRINCGGKFRHTGQTTWEWLSTLVPTVGVHWSGPVTCFKSQSLACTLLAHWEAGYADPWLIVTDLPPEAAQVCWYGLRAWIEGGFKDTKRGGWQWQQTRITDPARATRFWLAMALATLWTVSVGGEADATLPASMLDELPATHIARRHPPRPSPVRLLSCFRQGRLIILAAALHGAPMPVGHFRPEPWPGLDSLLVKVRT